MLIFGAGTIPMMLGIGLLGMKLQPALRFRLQRLIPVCLVMVGVLLILRGLAFGTDGNATADGQVSCPLCIKR